MRKSVTRATIAVFLATIARVDVTSLSAEPDEGTRQIADYVLAGLFAHRERLSTGEFQAQWVAVTENPSLGRGERASEIYGWFDHPGKKFRFDRRDRWVVAAEGGTGEDRHESGGRYVRTDELSIHAPLGGSAAVAVMAPDHPSAWDHFDVRLLGIAMPQEFAMGYGQFIAFFTQGQQLVEATREPGGLHRLAWVTGSPPDFKRVIWFNENKGFLAERFEGRVEYQGQESRLRYEMSLSAGEINGTWVPVNMSFKNLGNVGNVELALDWKSVNRPVPQVVFTTAGLELADGTYVTDARLGPPILTEIVGQRQPIAPMPTAIPTRVSSRMWIPWAVVLSAVFVLATLVVIYRRRRRAI
jgi:hypothetical protein